MVRRKIYVALQQILNYIGVIEITLPQSEEIENGYRKDHSCKCKSRCKEDN